MNNYKKYVQANPKLIGQIEQLSNIIPYLAFGRTPGHELEYEGATTLLNFIVFYHDIVLDKSVNKYKKIHTQTIVQLLHYLELSQVFLEMWALKKNTKNDEDARLKMILLIESIKFSFRLWIYLQYRKLRKISHHEELVPPKRDVLQLLNPLAPPPPPPNPNQQQQQQQQIEEKKHEGEEEIEEKEEINSSKEESVDFMMLRDRTMNQQGNVKDYIGRRSGKSILPLNSIKPVNNNTPSTDEQNVGELLSISGPMVNAISIYALGRQSWIPWFLSLLIETTSYKYISSELLSTLEKKELDRRRKRFMIYAIRPPFYTKFTHVPVDILISGLSSLPGIGTMLSTALSDFINIYQTYYFHTS